jgi:NAD(P)-dependent dehydrogenase (short-subunit alcohol dehydrogenase family)
MAVVCNVADSDSVAEAFKRVRQRFGRVDILVNNAGITRDALIHKMTNDQFDLVVKVSLYGTFYCIKQVVDGMRERGYGRIISMSSLASRGNVGQANYAAAKAGIVGLTKTLAMELGPKNVTVNCIAPSMINTDIIRTIPEKVLAGMTAAVPLRRVGEPEEVSALVAYLASDEGSYISGQCINITGGWW